MPNPDFALLVGIKNYGDAAFPALSGPVNDVALVADWLTKPDGGNLDPAHVTKILSVDPPPPGPANQMRPVPEEFGQALQAIVLDSAGHPVERPDARLYLYFSGHGFSALRDQ